MRRYFNTEGRCKPEEHYMANLEERLEQIKKLYVDPGKYFVMNRGRQYGKTTTLWALEDYLKEKNGQVIVANRIFEIFEEEEFIEEVLDEDM